MVLNQTESGLAVVVFGVWQLSCVGVKMIRGSNHMSMIINVNDNNNIIVTTFSYM
jgi:hypothetical protein